MNRAFIATITFSLLLQIFAAPVEARGGGHGGARGGGRVSHVAARSNGAWYLGSRGRGRSGGRGRRGYGSGYGADAEAQQAAYFDQRRDDNPYASVPQHVTVSNYIKNY